MKRYFKVLGPDLRSGGIHNSKPVQYVLGQWVKDPGPLTNEPLRGGLFVLNSLTKASALTKNRPTARVFECAIGRVLHQTIYLTKTDRVRLLREVER